MNSVTSRNGSQFDYADVFDPRIIAFGAPPGTIFKLVAMIPGDPFALLQKQDHGVTTNWKDIGDIGVLGSLLEGTVPAVGTLDLDTNLLTEFLALKYNITAKTPTLSKTLSMCVNNNAGALTEVVYAKTGSILPLIIDVLVVSGSMKLKFTNPNAFAVGVKAIKFLTGV